MSQTPSPQPDPTPSAPRSHLRELLAAFFIFGLAMALRIPALAHSLWYDEMHTLAMYIRQPWSHIVAGQYSPNNHTLFTLLAKLASSHTSYLPDLTLLIRLPSLIAGSLVPIALVWPIRRTCPLLALGIAIVAALHPWLITFSTWARGYALLMLLAILATNFLPRRIRWIDIPYTLIAALAMYTQPLAILLIAAHGATTFLIRREIFWTWFRSAALTGLITLALYAPYFAGAKSYWSRPEKPSISYGGFVATTLKYAVWGGDRGSGPAVAVSLLILTAGSYATWRNERLRPQILTFGITSILGLIAPIVIPLAGEVRAMLWLIPLYSINVVSLIAIVFRKPGFPRFPGAVTLLVLLATQIMADIEIARVPSQPIRDALDTASRLADGAPIIGIYMASREAGEIYGVIHYNAYQLNPDTPPRPDSLPDLKSVESKIPPNQHPYAIVFFDQFLKRDQPDLWQYIQRNYTPIQHFDGRLSPATLYRRNTVR